MMTACIILFSVAAVDGFIACFQTFGFTFNTRLAPARRRHLLDEVRLHDCAPIRDAGRDERHLERGDEQLVLSERKTAGIHLAGVVEQVQAVLLEPVLAARSTLEDGSSIGGFE